MSYTQDFPCAYSKLRIACHVVYVCKDVFLYIFVKERCTVNGMTGKLQLLCNLLDDNFILPYQQVIKK